MMRGPEYSMTLIPRLSDNDLIQAVVSGMLVALAVSALVFAAIGVVVALVAQRRIEHDLAELKGKILAATLDEMRPMLRKVIATMDNRLGYFEWSQSMLSALPSSERDKALEKAIDDAEVAFETWKQETETKDTALMASIRNNLAWYYADARVKRDAAMEHVAYLESLSDFHKGPNYLLTKAHVLIRFAHTVEEIQEGIRVYDLIQMQFGHLPGVKEKVAERRSRAVNALAQLTQGP